MCLCCVDGSFIGGNGRLQLIDRRLLVIDRLPGYGISQCQRLVPRKIFLGGNEQRSILGFFSPGLIKRGLEQARIYLGQHVALLYILPFGEQHLLQCAIDLGTNTDSQ
ncbi:hypothetical protein CDEN61S_00408 [Castellaniella denitrificans]